VVEDITLSPDRGAQGEEQSVRRGSVGESRIERVTIKRLKLDPRNPRLHSDRQIKQIAGSIKAFGFNVPVLTDQDGNVLADHGRVHAAQRLGLREIPVIRLEHLIRGQARAFSIADNRLSETASWDNQLFGSKPGTAAHDWRRSLGRPMGGAE
jgi:ParB-like chromosome segregation protein Spo0J